MTMTYPITDDFREACSPVACGACLEGRRAVTTATVSAPARVSEPPPRRAAAGATAETGGDEIMSEPSRI